LEVFALIIPRRSLLLTLLLIALVAVTACDQLSPAAPVDNTGSGVDLSDPNVGGGVGEDTGPQTPIPTATPTPENSPRLDATAEAIATFPSTAEPTTDSQPPTAAPTIVAPTAEPTIPPPAVEPPTVAPPTAEPTVTALEPSPTPAGETESSSETIHVVRPGENLYRIGLQYGLSWVVIAQYNGIIDPNAIVVGQELRIPPAPTATPVAQSSAPTTDDGQQTTDDGQEIADAVVSGLSSVVQVAPGDTLYSIAQQHGVSWDQVAEANGLTTPNQIYAGQVLKIPADVPGPTPEFAHQVHRGETLTGIARQYGQTPAALAEANGLSAPYVIYPGQQLVIPSDE
jgi:LysM repeat protein